MLHLLLLLLLFDVPTAPQIRAGCSLTDAECVGQTFLHSTLYLIAVVIWWPVRGLLAFARTLEGVYTWLVDQVLWSVYGTLLNVLYPWILIAAALAVLLFVSAQALIAIVRHSPVDARKGVWAGITALAILSIGARGLATLESARQFTGQYVFLTAMSAVQRAGPITFYTTTSAITDGMPPVATIYGGLSPSCPGMNLRRTTRDATGRDVSADQMLLNDYAALYVYADAIDIHCPPSALLLPHTFMVGDDSGFAGYFHFLGDSFASLGSADRGQQLTLAVVAIVRLIIAGVLAVGAILAQLLNLVFLAATTTALLGYAASRLIAFFVAFDGLQQQQQQALIRVFAASWTSYLWIGIALGLVHLVATQGNAQMTALAAFSTIGVVCWRIWSARAPLLAAASAASAMMSHMPRAGVRAASGGWQAGRTLATDAAMVGLGLATGGTTSLMGGLLRRAIPAMTRSTAGRVASSAASTWAARQRRTGARTAASHAPNWANTRSYAAPLAWPGSTSGRRASATRPLALPGSAYGRQRPRGVLARRPNRVPGAAVAGRTRRTPGRIGRARRP